MYTFQTVERKYKYRVLRHGMERDRITILQTLLLLHYIYINTFITRPFDRIKTDTNNESAVMKIPVAIGRTE